MHTRWDRPHPVRTPAENLRRRCREQSSGSVPAVNATTRGGITAGERTTMAEYRLPKHYCGAPAPVRTYRWTGGPRRGSRRVDTSRTRDGPSGSAAPRQGNSSRHGGAGGDWFGLKEHLFGGQPAEQPLAPHPPQVGALGRARRQFSGSRLTNGSAQYRRCQWQDLVVRQSEGVQPGRQTTVRGYCRTGFQQGRAPTADEQLTGRGETKMSDSVADGGSSTFSLF